jgi:hypothetical protein
LKKQDYTNQMLGFKKKNSVEAAAAAAAAVVVVVVVVCVNEIKPLLPQNCRRYPKFVKTELYTMCHHRATGYLSMYRFKVNTSRRSTRFITQAALSQMTHVYCS